MNGPPVRMVEDLIRTCQPVDKSGLWDGVWKSLSSSSAGKGILRTLCSYMLMAGDTNIHSVHSLGTSVNDHLKHCKGP